MRSRWYAQARQLARVFGPAPGSTDQLGNDLDDYAHEAWMAAWAVADREEARRPEWVRTVMRNRLRDLKRRAAARQSVDLDGVELAAPEALEAQYALGRMAELCSKGALDVLVRVALEGSARAACPPKTNVRTWQRQVRQARAEAAACF